MSSEIIGELFGVNIHSPIIRSEIREVLKRQLEFKALLQADQQLTEDQAFLEVTDIFESFFAKISETDRVIFEKIHAEEVNVAPKEWFNQLEEQNNINNGIFIEQGNAGSLYNILVVYPFTRENIRKIVQARSDLMKSIADSQGISLYQASNDLSDIQTQFIEKFNIDDQDKFLTIMTEELIAHTNAINDETSKITQKAIENEISNHNLTQTIGAVIVFSCLIFLFFVFSK